MSIYNISHLLTLTLCWEGFWSVWRFASFWLGSESLLFSYIRSRIQIQVLMFKIWVMHAQKLEFRPVLEFVLLSILFDGCTKLSYILPRPTSVQVKSTKKVGSRMRIQIFLKICSDKFWVEHISVLCLNLSTYQIMYRYLEMPAIKYRPSQLIF